MTDSFQVTKKYNKRPGANAEKIAVFRKCLSNPNYCGGAAQARRYKSENLIYDF